MKTKDDNFCCQDCRFFHRHYIPYSNKYIMAWCGHCVYPRIKHRRPDQKVCQHFQPMFGDVKKGCAAAAEG